MSEQQQLVLNYVASPTARLFHNDNSFFRGIMGPLGSGKSVACCWEIFQKMTQQAPSADGLRRTRWVVVRDTYAELESTTIKTWVDWFPPEVFGRMTAKPPYTHHVKFQDVRAEVIFLALDEPKDVKKLLSLECTGIWYNEARYTQKALIDAGTGRVGRYPAMKDGGCTWYGIIADTNPPEEEHWWYKFAEEEKPEGYKFFKQPSGLSPDAENTANLPPNYYKNLMAGKEQDWIKVYIMGQYGFVKDGKPIYNAYNDNVHFSEKVEYNKRLPLYIGLDFGLTPAAVFLQKGVMGNWVAIDEIVAEDMGAKRFGALLRTHIQEHYPAVKVIITGDPAGEQRTQTDETTPFEMLKSEGIYASAAPTNDFSIRVEVVQSNFGRLVDGVPGLVLGPKCRMLRKACAGGYEYKRMNVSGGDRFHDKPNKNGCSHVAEALQYGLLGGGEGKVVIRSYNPNKQRQQARSGNDYDELSY